MADVGDNNFIRYIYRGEEGEIIPRDATHIFVGEDFTFIRVGAFANHPNIVEVICHDNVEKIEKRAFYGCPNLRRVIMPGVEEIEESVFECCRALTDVECGKLEIVRNSAFYYCKSLRSINLVSARIVERHAFGNCEELTDVKFGSKLERIKGLAFTFAAAIGVSTEGRSVLERITIPLKDGLFGGDDDVNDNNAFMACGDLTNVDLVEGAVLQETIAALNFEEWRNDMHREIDSIYQILPDTPAGGWHDFEGYWEPGEKTHAIRLWLRSVLRKIIHYKSQHRRVLRDAATTLQFALPRDMLMNYVLSFLELPAHTFEGENDGEGEAVNFNDEGANERGVKNEQEGHGAEQGDDHDISGDAEGEAGNEEYGEHGSGRVKRQRL